MVERLKSVLIVVLTLSLVALLGLSFSLGIYGGQQGPLERLTGLIFPMGTGAGESESAFVPLPAAWPSQAAICGEAGIYAAITAQEYEVLCNLSSPVYLVYQEALGSSGEPAPMSEDDFMSLLQGPAIYLRWNSPLPLWMHYGWAESDGTKPDLPVETVVVGSADAQSVVLALATGDGRYFSMATGTNLQALLAACQVDEAPNSAPAGASAFYGGLPPYALICGDGNSASGGFVRLPEYRLHTRDYSGGLQRPMLEAFSLRYYLSESMMSAGGALRYMDGPSELTAASDGSLRLLRSSREEPITQGLAPGSHAETIRVVEYARALVTAVWQAAEASGQLSLESVAYDAGTYTVRFQWQLGGIVVETPMRPALVVVENGCLAAASVWPMTVVADETAAIAYPQYAAAAAASGGNPGLCYSWQPWAGEVTEGEQPAAELRPRVVVMDNP